VAALACGLLPSTMELISLKETREISETTREGSSLLKLNDAAEAMGFKTIGADFIQ